MMITVPIKTVSEANRSRHEHWGTTSKRVKSQRHAVALLARGIDPALVALGPQLVTLARIAPRDLDDDNLARCLKAVRDEVAARLGVDDRDPRVSWHYEQRRGRPKEYAVEIRVDPRGAP